MSRYLLTHCCRKRTFPGSFIFFFGGSETANAMWRQISKVWQPGQYLSPVAHFRTLLTVLRGDKLDVSSRGASMRLLKGARSRAHWMPCTTASLTPWLHLTCVRKTTASMHAQVDPTISTCQNDSSVELVRQAASLSLNHASTGVALWRGAVRRSPCPCRHGSAGGPVTEHAPFECQKLRV